MRLYVVSNSPPAALQLISSFRNVVVSSTFFLLLFSLIELSISGWIIAQYDAKHNPPNLSVFAWIGYLLAVSIWTFVIGLVYLLGYFVAATSIVASVASHFFLYVLFYSTYNASFSLKMSPLASFSHGFYG